MGRHSFLRPLHRALHTGPEDPVDDGVDRDWVGGFSSHRDLGFVSIARGAVCRQHGQKQDQYIDVVLLFDEYEPGYETSRRTLSLPAGTRTVVLIDSAPTLGPTAATRASLHPVYQGAGGAIRVLDAGSATTLEYGYGWVELR